MAIKKLLTGHILLVRASALTLVLFVCSVSLATEPVIFGAAHIGPEGESTLYRIDPSTGIATAVGTGIGFQRVSGMDFDPRTGVLYATGEREAGDLDVNVLMRINVSTGVGKEIGPTGVVDFVGLFDDDPDFPGVFSDLSFNPVNQKLYGFSYPGHWVAVINLKSGMATQVAYETVLGDRGLHSIDGDAITFLSKDTLLHAGGEAFLDVDCCNVIAGMSEIDLSTNTARALYEIDYPEMEGFDANATPRANAMEYFAGSNEVFASIVYGFGANKKSTFVGIIRIGGAVDILGQTTTGMDALAMISSIDIDVRPFKKKTRIWPKKLGVIPVVIFGSEEFDPLQVNIPSVRFGPEGAKAIDWLVIPRDANHDGYVDLGLFFKTRKSGIRCGDTSVSLIGSTYDGEPFMGTDAISTVSCGEHGN